MKIRTHIFTFIIASTLLISGCSGSFIRAIVTGDNFSEMAPTMPIVGESKGRLFIYMVGRGPNVFDTTGKIDFVSVDRKVLRYLGKSFVYLDVPIGKHLLTTDGVFVDKLIFVEWRYGKNKFEINLEDGETKYIKISAIDLTMNEVGSSQAKQELSELPYYNDQSALGKAIIPSSAIL